MNPPVVSIISPGVMENITGDFEISGTATDQEEIVAITISLEKVGTSWKREWRAERGNWTTRNSASDPWAPFTEGTWIQNGGRGNILWTIQTSEPEAGNGEYLITAGAKNNVDTEGAKTQRRVVIDIDPPVVTIYTPELKKNYSDFDAYTLRDMAVLEWLHNESVTIQYEVADDFSIASVSFELEGSDGRVYYQENRPPRFFDKFSISEDNIRKLNGNIFNFEDESDKIYLQIKTTAKDKAGNERDENHGWLVWWPASDRPWIDGVGHETNASLFSVFPKTEIQGQAFDDDGVAQVSYKVYEGHGAVGTPRAEETLTNRPLVAGGSPSTFFAWKFPAPENPGEYTIVMDCKDVNGTEGVTITRYFYVMDTDKPTVVIEEPVFNETMFGNTSGIVTIRGYVEDRTSPDVLRMAWINPKGNDPTGSRINYRDQTFASWNGSSPDASGNRLWTIALGTPTLTDGRMRRSFSQPINLFNDLGIATPVGTPPETPGIPTQYFVFRVQTNAVGSVPARAATAQHTVRGDVEPPTLDIKGITLTRGATNTVYLMDENGNLSVNGQPQGAIMVMEKNDTLTLNGTWSDDSWAHWGTTSGVNRMGDFTVTWNSKAVTGGGLNYTTPAPNSTWTAGPWTVPDDELLKGGGFIQVSLKDLTGNRGSLSRTVKVDTNVPVLQYATSEKDDGHYKNGTAIQILLEFNTEVTYFGNNAPVLNMTVGGNAAGTATWDSTSNGKTTHVFNYTVGNQTTSQTGDLLSIDTIVMNGGNWGAVAIGPYASPVFPAGGNLGDRKKLYVDNAPPSIKQIMSLTGVSGVENYNRAGTIYIRVDFNEEITYANNSAFSLTLNAIRGSSYVTVTDYSLLGREALLFIYTIAVDNTPTSPSVESLRVTGYNLNGVTDLAENALGSSVYTNIHEGPTAKTIYIDTASPIAPAINGISAGNFSVPQNFTIVPSEAVARLEYQISFNGEWSSWEPYTRTSPIGEWDSWTTSPGTPVPIQNPGTYIIRARQYDRAGNVSASRDSPTFTIETNDPLLVSFGGSPTGTYKAGQLINIDLNMRENITIGGTGTMTLTLNNGGTATLTSGSGTATLRFSFTPANSTHDIDPLKITAINMDNVALNRPGTPPVNLASQITADNKLGLISTGKGLDFYTKIKIDTSTPTFTRAELNATGTQLTLIFNKEIYKGTGNITLTVPVADYRAPAVLTRSEYLRYNTGNALANHYTAGTNGTNATFVAYTDEKYILNWTINPADNNGDNAARNALVNAGANKVEVAVVSGAVKKGDEAANNTLIVDLSPAWGYVLPVKGVGYTLTFPNTLIQDSLNNNLPATPATITVNALANPGVNQPYVRIQKTRGDYSPTTETGMLPVQTNATAVNMRTAVTNSGVAWTYGYNRNGTYAWPDSEDNLMNRTVNSYWVRTVNGDRILQAEWNPAGPDDNEWNTPWRKWWADILGVTYNGGLLPSSITVLEELGGGTWALQNTTRTRIVVTQPTTAQVKIDCQTPDATIGYSYQSYSTTPVEGTSATPFNGTSRPAQPGTGTPSTPTTGTAPNTVSFTLGNATNITDGYLYNITATATKGTSVTAYDKAARSVIRFLDINNAANWSELGTIAGGQSKTLNLWLRGGDQASGANLTPGFPLAWDEKDYGGARLLTHDSGIWYWITWEVSARPALFHFLAGTVRNPATTQEAATIINDMNNGPRDWSWGKNAWAFQHDKYPLHPGGSLAFSAGTGKNQGNPKPGGDYNGTWVTFSDMATDKFEFYGNFGGSR
jgi:hypothetical protein